MASLDRFTWMPGDVASVGSPSTELSPEVRSSDVQVETKITIQTSEVDGHRHERFFPEGTIQAGTYRTSEVDGHFHFFTIGEDLSPGESRQVTTSPPDGAETGHQHSMTIRAISEKGMHGDCPEGEDCPEHRQVTGRILEIKRVTRPGVNVGVFEGYIATWDEDTGGKYGVPDQFVRGAFQRSLEEHRQRGMRPIRLKDAHGRTIGGFPIETAVEDEVGLKAVGEVNLDTQLGREAWALIKQGVLTDLSIGFISVKERFADGGRKRVIEEAQVVEGSVVDEPANRKAVITEVKAVVPFQDLPLAPRDRAWDSAAAVTRVRAATGSEEAPSATYRRAFLWFDSAQADQFGGYKLPIADVIDGRLTAVPRAIFAVAAVMSGGRGGVDVPAEDRAGIIRHLERYYSKMDLESPFNREERQFVGAIEAKAMSVREVEEALCRCGGFSKGAAKILAGRMGPAEEPCYDAPESKAAEQILEDLRAATESLRRGRQEPESPGDGGKPAGERD